MKLSTALRRYLPPQDSPEVLDVRALLGAVEWLNKKAHDGAARKEYMLCIVKLGNHLHTPHEVKGTESNVNQECDVQNDHYGSYKGSIHIHPPVEGDFYSFGFSLYDFYHSLKDGDHLGMVVSGPNIYALYRTADTRRLDDISLKEWDEYIKDEEGMYEDDSKSTLQCQEEFTRRMCSRLGYVLYAGSRRKGLLEKVWVP